MTDEMTEMARMRVEPMCPKCGSTASYETVAETDPPTIVVPVECDTCDWRGMTQVSVPQPPISRVANG